MLQLVTRQVGSSPDEDNEVAAYEAELLQLAEEEEEEEDENR